MTKLKTNKSVFKRFRFVNKESYKHKQSHLRHILTKKSSKRKRKLRPLKYVDKSHLKTLKKALPYNN